MMKTITFLVYHSTPTSTNCSTHVVCTEVLNETADKAIPAPLSYALCVHTDHRFLPFTPLAVAKVAGGAIRNSHGHY